MPACNKAIKCIPAAETHGFHWTLKAPLVASFFELSMLMRLRFLITVMLFSVHSIANAYWPSVDECYEIDGPANVRDDINGKLLMSLNSDHKVKILEVHSLGWFKISYSELPNVCGGSSVGWTYKYNLKPIARDINEMVGNNRVRFIYPEYHYPQPGINYDHEMKGVWLFGEFQAMEIEPNQEIYLSNPMLLYQYCSDGSQIVNELNSVFLGYGGDSGSYSPVFRFKKKTSSACLTVNGRIIGLEQHTERTVTQSYCEMLVNDGKEIVRRDLGLESSLDIPEQTISCDYIDFPYQLESSKVSITIINYNTAPSYHRWDFWVEEKRHELGGVSSP